MLAVAEEKVGWKSSRSRVDEKLSEVKERKKQG